MYSQVSVVIDIKIVFYLPSATFYNSKHRQNCKILIAIQTTEHGSQLNVTGIK